MIVDGAQRWRDRCDSYRPKGEPIDTRQYEIAAIAGDDEARAFVERHHYSTSYPAAVERFGLYRRGELVGVVVFSEPVQGKVLDVLPCPRDQAAELGRLVSLQDVPANGESWLIAECFRRLARTGYTGIVSFADPQPRLSRDGRAVFAGHLGYIYQASNAGYTGLSSPRTIRLRDDGTVLSDRTMSKIRKLERGWRYAVEQVIAAGAAPPATGEDLRAWLRRELQKISRPMRHHGNHRYVWALDRAGRRTLPDHLKTRGLALLPYPKISVVACRADQVVPPTGAVGLAL